MKIILYFLSLTLFIGLLSCNSDDDRNSTPNPNNNALQVVATMTSGNWRITSFTEDSDDHTDDFAGFTFTFGNTGVLTATNGSSNRVGAWSVTSDDNSNDDNSNSDLDFNISFVAPADFAELTEDWHILERTDTKLRLRHVSGGNGGTDLLTFEKNS